MGNYFTREELLELGFSSVGENNFISKNTKFYKIDGTIGSANRIDDFCILKGNISIGNKVHICSHTSLSGVGGKISINDLCGIGVNSIFYTASDDMLVSSLCGPIVNKKSTSIKSGNIILDKGVAIGGRVTIMPDVHIGAFSAIGLLSIITKDIKSYSIYMTINGQLQRIGSRKKEILEKYAKEELKNF